MPLSLPSRSERPANVLALGHAPDWGAVIGAIRETAKTDSGGTRLSAAELGREALVVTFAFFLAAESPGRIGAHTRTTVRALATVAELRDERVRGTVQRLASAGVLRDLDGGTFDLPASSPAWDDALAGQLADWVLRPAPAAHVLRWDVVRERAGGSTRALAATAAFLELLPVPREWTTVSLHAVGEVTQYAGRKVGEVVQRAVACGVVEERRERGSANLYRFASAVLRGGSPDAEVSNARQEFGTVARRESGAPSLGMPRPSVPERGAPQAGGNATMRPVVGAAILMVGGVPLPLPPGAQPQLEVDADGRYWYRVGTLHFGPVRFD